MDSTHTHAFFRRSISPLLLLLILSMPSSVILAQDDPPTCIPPDQQCSSEIPPPENDVQPAAIEAVQAHVASPPPSVTPIVSDTPSQ
ncbi:MAG: hypothetical protein ABW157_17740 [Candidatus Thiodiazotropha sp. LLP2]